METILKRIKQLTDTTQLETVIQVAQRRLEELRRQPEVIHLVLYKGQWYGIKHKEDPIRRHATQLGPRLTPAVILKLIRTTGPTRLDFEISEAEADQRRKTDRESVGWVEESVGKIGINRRFYSVPDYESAITTYRAWHDLAVDPVAVAYGLSVEAIAQMRKWEAEGCQICFPDTHASDWQPVVSAKSQSPITRKNDAAPDLSPDQAAAMMTATPNYGSRFTIGLPKEED